MGRRPVADVAHSFEDEVFFRLRGQRSFAVGMAAGSIVLALGCVIALLIMLPLKEVRPYVIMVDRTTGQAERVVQVRPAQLSEQEVVRDALLVGYVVDRETYDIADNAERIPHVLELSSDQARASLIDLWSPSNEEYPPDTYGRDVRITVTITSVSMLNDNAAQVRFLKRREAPGDLPIERDFVATVGFDFNPRTERRLEDVWENPLGFTVVSYRVDAETLQPRARTENE